jgi:hypothetical protein
MPAHPGILFSIAFGLAMAGAVALGYEILTRRKASFRLLGLAPRTLVATVPFLVVTAPFIILRNTLRGRRIEGRPLIAVAVALSLAASWSAASGSAIAQLLSTLLL